MMRLFVLAGLLVTLSGCGTMPPAAKDDFFNKFTYYNDTIPAQASKLNYYPGTAAR